MRYYLNIGTNLGNKMLNLSKAVKAIEQEFGWFELSQPVESEPWGFESNHKFINIGMLIISDLPPIEVLKKIKLIEKRISPTSHRKPDGSYADRIIDIDIMSAEETSSGRKEITLSTPELTLPHPHLQERPFFLQTYCELKEK